MRHMTLWRLTAALATGVIAAVAVACSGTTRPAGSAPSTSRRVLLGDEIRGASATNAYDAVQRLRPEWLRRRGQISIQDPSAGAVVVYLDGVRFGGPQSLENLRPEGIVQMEYLDASDATIRFGTGHGGGVILVTTR